MDISGYELESGMPDIHPATGYGGYDNVRLNIEGAYQTVLASMPAGIAMTILYIGLRGVLNVHEFDSLLNQLMIQGRVWHNGTRIYALR